MARPTNANAAKTRRTIREAAMRRFAELGMSGASVRLIAKDAGVSLAMVHHYFGSKEELYLECIGALYKEIQADLMPTYFTLFDGKWDAQQIVERAVRTCYAFARERQHQVRLLLRNIMEHGDFPKELQDVAQHDLLQAAAQAAAKFLNLDVVRVRNVIQQVTIVVSRLATASTRELMAIAGTQDPIEAVDIVVDELVVSTLQMLTRFSGNLDAPASNRYRQDSAAEAS